jgi:hypothetical protein
MFESQEENGRSQSKKGKQGIGPCFFLSSLLVSTSPKGLVCPVEIGQGIRRRRK